MAPPANTQEPVVSSNASVVPPLPSDPVTFTVPPERLNVPKSASAKVPPKLTVELLLEVMVPELCHGVPLRPSVPPWSAWSMPVFDQFPSSDTSPPSPSMVPSLVHWLPVIVSELQQFV